MTKSLIRMRMSSHDAHYGDNLVNKTKMLQLFGDVATELSTLVLLLAGYKKFNLRLS